MHSHRALGRQLKAQTRNLPGRRSAPSSGSGGTCCSRPAAAVLFLFPLWGILHPNAYTLANLLPFAALGWLCLGAIAAGALRAKRPARLEALGRVFTPATDQPADTHR
jgi:hypothetical protein